MHALHTMHAVPDLRVAGGRLGDGGSDLLSTLMSSRVHRLYGNVKPNINSNC